MIDGDGLMKCSHLTTGIDPSCLATDQLLHQVAASDWLVRAGYNNRLITAATWAERFPAESIDPHQLSMPGGDRPIQPGGDGTPELARFCVTELAATLHKSTGACERIIADALDLRHRLPACGPDCVTTRSTAWTARPSPAKPDTSRMRRRWRWMRRSPTWSDAGAGADC